MVEKKLWIQLKRLDLKDIEPVASSAECLDIGKEQSADAIRHILKSHFNIYNEDLILRLRNHNGSLVPVNRKLVTNSRDEPYVLEIVRVYQHSHPLEWSPYRAPYDEAIKKQIKEITTRIEKLEESVPELHHRRFAKINAEMVDLDQKLGFINKRINEADSTHWRGMFKRNPLW
ncbi:uncharacterized protein LOC121369661 [Gigantopelta aegis]|uniref:uncharacterized protein LOC121369661 n=1 Tax=Gigantopelta aegis TaxID=1735272 RepID=UPI001B88BFB7|nr:uncharacterized protein LOC121369661 [Gigantopelta aegis]